MSPIVFDLSAQIGVLQTRVFSFGEPHDELIRLYQVHPAPAERIDHWLDQIEANPADGAVLHRLIRPGSLWAITVVDPGGRQDYLIIWDVDGEIPVIRYLGPDVLRAQHNR